MQGKDFKERDCMSLEGFCSCVRLDLQRKAGDSFDVMVTDITKNNDRKLKALIIAGKDTNIHPSIYMDGFYDRYVEGTPLAEIEEDILCIWQENRIEKSFDSTCITKWENVQGNVIYKLISLGRNRELLKDVPHREMPDLDLAFVYECFFGTGKEGCGTILIHENHLEMWGITADELFDTAERNTPELMDYNFLNMAGVLQKLLGSGEDAEEQEVLSAMEAECHMYVLTNKYRTHGAGCIFYKNLLKEIAEKWDCDICIIPSSIHETILLPVDTMGSCGEISEMVRTVNQTQLRPEEILSDNAYQFNRETGKIIMQEEMPC